MTHSAAVTFDAVITLHKRPPRGRRSFSGREADAVAAVRAAVEAMEGACSIDVEAYSFPTQLDDLVVLYPQDQYDRLQGWELETLHRKVEEVALAALQDVGLPYWARTRLS